jgi:hypothetical protein
VTVLGVRSASRSSVRLSTKRGINSSSSKEVSCIVGLPIGFLLGPSSTIVTK